MTLKDNCMCLEDLEQRTARLKMSEGQILLSALVCLPCHSQSPWTGSSLMEGDALRLSRSPDERPGFLVLGDDGPEQGPWRKK